jgi:DNA (cytosine-5)-methyltransferase 1
MITHGSLFSGIGGFDLAASQMGWQNVFQVEKDAFCQKVLKKNFPNTTRYGDIKNFDGSEYAGKIDVISGGFPCQPYSLAGKRGGSTDDRALWPEMLRVIEQIKPSFVVAENVAGFTSMDEPTSVIKMADEKSAYVYFEKVAGRIIKDLEGIGYKLPTTAGGEPIICVIPACSVGAIHRRERVWIIAYANREGIGDRFRAFGQQGRTSPENRGKMLRPQYGAKCSNIGRPTNPNATYANRQWQLQPGWSIQNIGEWIEYGCSLPYSYSNGQRCWKQHSEDSGNGSGRDSLHAAPFGHVGWYPDSSEILRTAYGIPGRMDGRYSRIKGLGNAIVPQVAYNIFQFIQNTFFL